MIELAGIEKSFGGVQALRGADFSAQPGEIHALCGENGAGKSTLLKVLSGVYPHTSYRGTVRVAGREQRFLTTTDARDAGIAIVHQELMLVPELSVTANLMLGRESGRLGLVDDDAMEADARALLRRFGVAREIDPSAPVGTLGIGLQQVVEIVRALSVIGGGTDPTRKILVLDEPTAALTSQETDRLMTWLRELRSEGTTCVYVSHRMDEVFALCDRVTVLRDGKTVGTVDAKTTPAARVVSMMVGRELATKERRALTRGDVASAATPVLSVRDLRVPLGRAAREEDGARNFAIENLSFEVAPGEILAVCGAMGSGRTALLASLFGCARHGFAGSISVNGKVERLRAPEDAIAAGIAFVPEDRKGHGLVLGMTVAENLSMPPTRARVGGVFEALGLVDEDAEEAVALRRIDELRIRGAAASPSGALSGGNQQKVVLGKWLGERQNAVLLLLDEPTRGVDVGAREEIYALIETLTESGTAVVFASSDLAEVLRLGDRIVVLRHGRAVGELSGASATEEAIVALSTGASRGEGQACSA